MGRKRKPPQGPRMDEFGYLLHLPRDRSCVLSEWIGEPTGTGVIVDYRTNSEGVNVNATYYEACQYGEYTLRCPVTVYLEATKVREGSEICTVTHFYAVDDEDAPK